MASTGRTSGGLLDDVQKSTTATVSRLSCNVAVDTAEFMMNASVRSQMTVTSNRHYSLFIDFLTIIRLL